MVKYNVFDVCNYILHKESMTPTRLQKELYFCYAFYLAKNNDKGKKFPHKLFKGKFEAWINGPVISKVFNKYAKYNMCEICVYENFNTIDEKDAQFLNLMIENLKQYSTPELESILRNQSPWINARGKCKSDDLSKNKLSDIDIYECFSSMVYNG